MILVDANLILYAEDADSAFHKPARRWWDEQLSGGDPVCLTWETLNTFLRIRTNPRVYRHPLSIHEAEARIDAWLAQPCVRILHASSRHWSVFRSLIDRGQATANLIADAHLAAIAIEHNCMLCTTDADFSRFPGLRWKNPL